MRLSVFTILLSLGIVHATESNVLNARDLVTELWDEIEEAIESGACQVAIEALKLVADFGDTVFIDTLTELCELSGNSNVCTPCADEHPGGAVQAEDDDVCSGIMEREGPALSYILGQLSLGSEASDAFCSSAFGLGSYPTVREYNLVFSEPKPNTTRPAPSGESPIHVVHFSDTHVDLSYETGSNWNCTKPICCRAYDAADAPGNTTTPCGPYGNTNCDPPLSLEESMFASIEVLDPTPAFSIYTGDVVAHDVWLVDEDEVLIDLNATYSRMANVGKVFAAVGNHDVAPVNEFPISSVPSEYNVNWTYEALSADFGTLSGDSSVISVADQYGSYSSIYTGSYGTDLKVISYNSIFYYVDNFFAYLDPMPYDPDGQLAWLIDELQASETAGQRVWLIAHIPTSSSDHLHDYSHYLNEIILRYDATIAAVFFGHTHVDEFQLWYSNYSDQTADTATAMGYIMPSLTPTSGPPSYRIYDIDPVTFGVLDYTNYIANISAPDYQNGPTWIEYYSAKEAYGSLLSPPVTDAAAELTPAFWHNVTELFETDDDVFQDYIARESRGWDVSSCTGTCKTDAICAIRAGDAQYNCVVPDPSDDFSKRSIAQTESSEKKCDDAGLVSLLNKMAVKIRKSS